ncbi:ABC transporter substrate-binding protein [Siminovitchia terrae]|uniref:ABC transporter substrate-binding protein n=1 Tax=Siminovitchia terrae TaxID=1914933 RepID=A0A429X5W3_SIMTE|nr:ABC transporter substrate-binding protein [Siminovitchia terrae]RST58816.1 ABC transporter substrate-binding protein [Siminovitchia terrae]
MRRLLLSLFILALLVGCSSEGASKSKSGGKKDGDSTLNVAYMAQPPTFDPHMTTAVATRDIMRNVFETLLSVDENNEVVPLLADSFEFSDNFRDVTFKLRKGVKFHNGQEMTADDVVASMNRWKTTNGQANAYLSKSEFVKEDDYTVVLHMDKPYTIIKYLLAMDSNFAGIMPKEVIENADKTGVKEYIGTGPFKFDEWKQDQFVKMSKNEEYQSSSETVDGLVGLREALVDDLVINFVSDSQTRMSGIQTGEYDVALAIPSDNVPQLENDPNVNVHIAPGGYTVLIFNKKKGLFTDLKARQAVNLAVEKEAVMLSAFTNDHFYTLEGGLLGEAFPSWKNDEGLKEYNAYDPEAAKKLLKEAGYNGEKIRLITTRDYEDQYQSAVVVQQYLEKIGVNVDLQVYDWPSLMELREDENNFDLQAFAFAPATNPINFYYLDSRDDYSGWSNSPEIDKYNDELKVAKTDEEASKAFASLQKATWEYLPAIKYGEYNRVTVARSNLEGFKWFNGPLFWNVEKK